MKRKNLLQLGLTKLNLQLHAEAVSGKKIVYLYRVLEDAPKEDATRIAYTTDNSLSIDKDADTTKTKDGTVRTPGQAEVEISATSIFQKGDQFIKKLRDAMLKDKIIEIWKVNLEAPKEDGQDKFEGTYFQGYLTSFEESANAEDLVEYTLSFGINGTGVDGDVTVTTDQQDAASYAFADTKKTGV